MDNVAHVDSISVPFPASFRQCVLVHYTGSAAEELDLFLGGRMHVMEVRNLGEPLNAASMITVCLSVPVRWIW